MWNCRGPRIPTAILKKKNKARGLIPFDFKIFYKSTVIQAKYYWCEGDKYNNGAEERVQKYNDPYMYNSYSTHKAPEKFNGKNSMRLSE